MLLLLDRVVPVEPGFEELHPPVEAEDDILVDIGGTGLEQADGDVRVLAQASGDRGSGRSASDDDVVKAVRGIHGDSPHSLSVCTGNQPVTAGSRLW